MLGLGISKTPVQQSRAVTSMLGMFQKAYAGASKEISNTSFDNLSGMTMVVFCEQQKTVSFGSTFQIQQFFGITGSDGSDKTGLELGTNVNWSTVKSLQGECHDGSSARTTKNFNIIYDRWAGSGTGGIRKGSNKYCLFARFKGSDTDGELTIGYLSSSEIIVNNYNISMTGDQDLGVLNGGAIGIGQGIAPAYNSHNVKVLKASLWKNSLTDGKILALTGQLGDTFSNVDRPAMRNYRMRSRFESYSDLGAGDPACEYDFTRAGNNTAYTTKPGPLAFVDATCDTTSGDATVTCNTNSKIKAGQGVYGTGIPDGTTVDSVNTPGAVTSFELSANATASNTNVSLTFGEVIHDAITSSDRIDLITISGADLPVISNATNV